MYRSRRKAEGPTSHALPVAAVMVLCAATLSACGLLDLRDVGAWTYPDTPYQVLKDLDQAVRFGFDGQADRIAAERSFRVTCPDGVVDGDFEWTGEACEWSPVGGWEPCVRYRLVFRGEIRMSDGRMARPCVDLPFYAERAGRPPFVAGAQPLDGASVGVWGSDARILKLDFSEPMDTASVFRELSLSPGVNADPRWSADGKTLELVLNEALEPCVQYRWSLSAEARSADGSALGGDVTGSFVSDADRTPPYPARAVPVGLTGGRWLELGATLDELKTGQSLGVRFSEAMDPHSAAASVRVGPGVSGNCAAAEPDLVVFTPAQEWPPESALVLTVSGDAEDASGLPMGNEWTQVFRPAVPYLRVLSMLDQDGSLLEQPSGGELFRVAIGPEPDGDFYLSVRFSGAFDDAGKVLAVEDIALAALFPSTLPAPHLTCAEWVSDDTIALSWEGLSAGNSDCPHYYRLRITGGTGGIQDRDAHVMDGDLSLYLEG